jgi:hypothetical protein
MPTSAQPLSLPAASPPPSSSSSIEQLIGELTATAACLVAQGLSELWRTGQIRMSADTRQQGGALMAALIELKSGTVGDLAEAGIDFERVARAHGASALRERCNGNVSQRTIDELVAAVLDIMAGIIRLRLN